ncbi:MAG: hypothetical protein EPO06_11670 [Burkholderiaceae bacterium]|nr:MAG: hypothetical protein EPO06_11670 [Burkholderiaceae bacterium]
MTPLLDSDDAELRAWLHATLEYLTEADAAVGAPPPWRLVGLHLPSGKYQVAVDANAPSAGWIGVDGTRADTELLVLARNALPGTVAATRAIFASFDTWEHDDRDDDLRDVTDSGGQVMARVRHGACRCGLNERRSLLLRHLAAAFAHMPGYQPHWSPQ